jgi:glutathione S-transferase
VELVAIVTGLALVEYVYISFQVGAARGKYNVPAPATTGDPIFERTYRVQHNTLEQLIVFVPAIWMFASYVNAPTAAALGLVFILGRTLYLVGYVKDPASRSTGFLVSFLANAVLLLGGLGGAAYALL